MAVCLSCRVSQTVNLHLIRGRRKSNIGSWRTLELRPAIYVRGVSGGWWYVCLVGYHRLLSCT